MRLSTPYGTVSLVFGSRVAGRMAGSWGAVTPCASVILIAGDRIDRETLAEEIGHTVSARKRGPFYLPWVFAGYLRKGYDRSKVETEGKLWGQQHAHELPQMVFEDGTIVP